MLNTLLTNIKVSVKQIKEFYVVLLLDWKNDNKTYIKWSHIFCQLKIIEIHIEFTLKPMMNSFVIIYFFISWTAIKNEKKAIGEDVNFNYILLDRHLNSYFQFQG